MWANNGWIFPLEEVLLWIMDWIMDIFPRSDSLKLKCLYVRIVSYKHASLAS